MKFKNCSKFSHPSEGIYGESPPEVAHYPPINTAGILETATSSSSSSDSSSFGDDHTEAVRTVQPPAIEDQPQTPPRDGRAKTDFPTAVEVTPNLDKTKSVSNMSISTSVCSPVGTRLVPNMTVEEELLDHRWYKRYKTLENSVIKT